MRVRLTAILILLVVLILCPFSQGWALTGDGSADLKQAVLQYYQADPDTCLKTLQELSEKYPINSIIRVNLIRLLRESGHYQEAIEQLKKLIQQNSSDSRYRLDLLQTTYLAGQWHETVRLSADAELSAAELYWRGLALGELGKDAVAAKTLTESLAKEAFNPMAYYRLGQFSQKAGDFEQAAAYYKKAAAQEPNLTLVYLPLAQIYLAFQKYASAYVFLQNAKASRPWDPQITAAWQSFLAEHPEVLQQRQAEAQRTRQVVAPPRVIPAAGDRDKIPEIRIGLAEKIDRLYLKTGDRYRLSAQSGTNAYRGDGQTVLNIKRNGRGIEFRNEQGALLFTAEGNIVLTYDNPAATTVLFDVEYGEGTYWAGREDRVYRGNLQFLPRENGITIVNRLNMEEYLYGVLPSEMESTWPLEALAAQAVAARTYAFANLRAYDARGFDLMSTVASQAYRGVRGERTATNAAVDATRGTILCYHGKPISAFYCGNNGGYSNSSQDVWGFSLPYLQAVPDKALSHVGPMSPVELAAWLTSRPRTYSNNPQYSGRSQYRWVAWVSRSEIENRLNKGDRLGRILTATVTGRSLNGLVTKVTIKGTTGDYTVTGDAIRAKLGGLRSNIFIVEPRMGARGQPEGFIFSGGGFGHGVGLCQSGAAGMAADGHKYAEILEHYYPGTKLTKLY